MWLHVVLLGAIPLVVPVMATRGWGRPSTRRIVLAVVLPLLLAVLALMMGVHACDRGVPVTQWAIPCVAMGIVIACVGPSRLRRVTATVLAIIAIVLTLDFAGRVHDDDVVGSTTARCTTAHRLWHTPLTGFYAATPGDCDR